MTKKKWPNDYPAHITLPPNTATEFGAYLFRIVNKPAPDADDFLASYKDPKQKNLARNPKIKNKPGFYGTSFFNTEVSIKKLVEESPERFSGQMIAAGNVSPDHGKGDASIHTSHVSMWFYEGVYPKGFEII